MVHLFLNKASNRYEDFGFDAETGLITVGKPPAHTAVFLEHLQEANDSKLIVKSHRMKRGWKAVENFLRGQKVNL